MRRPVRLLASGVVAASFGLVPISTPALAVPASVATAVPTPAQLIGQKLVVAMTGTTPSVALLGRVRRGEVGGVILFGANITTAGSVRALTSQLEAAAAAGGQPPLLIATDQEGGTVRRVPWAPPTLSAPQMGSLGSTTTAQSQGTAAAQVLLCAGINADFAPVADVPSSTASFMYQQGRTWSFSTSVTASLSGAFATGLSSGGLVPAMKHFPGIGAATLNTDSHVVTITASQAQLSPGLDPYRKAIAAGIPLIMLSNAVYTAYDSVHAAGWSRAVGVDLLRTTLGFRGATITDSLTGAAAARGVSPTSLALDAAVAGTDMILLTGSEASTAATYSSLLSAASAGTIPASTLQASYQRILALKAALRSSTPDSTPPAVAAPGSRLVVGTTLAASSVPVRTSWSRTDPCGISGEILERRVNGGSWIAQPLASAATTSVTQSLGLGSVDRYVVKAVDGAGNTSGWAYGPFMRLLVAQDGGGGISYRGSWRTASSSSFSGGTTHDTGTAGSSATYGFTASSVAWVAAVGPTRGSAAVYLDGVYRATVSLYATTPAARRLVYAAGWGSPTWHTIRIVALGTTGHPSVDVDAFVRLIAP